MLHNDSVDKVITRYFATVTRQRFLYGGQWYEPKTLKVSPLLLRDYTCPTGCGGCCFKFTLDYLPTELHPEGVQTRIIEFNKKRFTILTDGQIDNPARTCRHLQKDGRCGIYERRPFTCDFELIRTMQTGETRPNVLTQKLFGRGWSYHRADGGKGALCQMTPITDKSIAEVIRKLKRLKNWTDYFELDTWIPDIITLIENGRLQKSEHITFHPPTKVGFGL